MILEDAPVVAGIIDKDPAVLDFAQHEAQHWDAPMLLVHTYLVPPSAFAPICGLDIPAAYRDGAEDVIRAAVDHIRSNGSTGSTETRVVRDSAPRTLERLSNEARTVVIGQDSHKSWAVRLFEGHTGRHLVRHSRCPLVVVPDSWQRPLEDAPVVAVVDRVNRPDGALRYAFETAQRSHARVRIVQADSPFGTGADLNDHRERLSRLLESWRSWYPDVRVQPTVLTGDPAEVASCSEPGAERLVISRAVGSPHLWPSAPMARAIARNSRCPVVVVPPDFSG